MRATRIVMTYHNFEGNKIEDEKKLNVTLKRISLNAFDYNHQKLSSLLSQHSIASQLSLQNDICTRLMIFQCRQIDETLLFAIILLQLRSNVPGGSINYKGVWGETIKMKITKCVAFVFISLSSPFVIHLFYFFIFFFIFHSRD